MLTFREGFSDRELRHIYRSTMTHKIYSFAAKQAYYRNDSYFGRLYIRRAGFKGIIG